MITGIKSKYVFEYIGQKKIDNPFFETTADNFFHAKVQHPKINMSKGEAKIFEFLNKRKINFKKEFTFKNLKDKGTLRFDFAIFDTENNLKFLIEFQGLQHYLKEGKFVTPGSKKRDNLKKEYCKKNNLNLLEISYKEINSVENILENYFYSETNERK